MTDAEIRLKHGSEFHRCLVDLDVQGVMRLHKHVAPHLPQPSESETLISLHMARTKNESIPLKLRQYSASWLKERGVAAMKLAGS